MRTTINIEDDALLVIRNQRIGAFGSGPLAKVALSFRSRS